MRVFGLFVVMLVLGCADDECELELDATVPVDGGSAVTCGREGDMCCTGMVNGVPTPVCHGETRCEEGVCTAAGACTVETPWNCPDATTAPDADPADAFVPCGTLGLECCETSGDGSTPFCHAPYHCHPDLVCRTELP